MSSFYARRSWKCKKTVKLSVFFTLLASAFCTHKSCSYDKINTRARKQTLTTHGIKDAIWPFWMLKKIVSFIRPEPNLQYFMKLLKMFTYRFNKILSKFVETMKTFSFYQICPSFDLSSFWGFDLCSLESLFFYHHDLNIF